VKVAFLEANCSWLPWLLWRLDEGYEREGDIFMPDLAVKPSDYFKRQCWISVEPDEAPARYTIEEVGCDQLVFSTDYPHGDCNTARRRSFSNSICPTTTSAKFFGIIARASMHGRTRRASTHPRTAINPSNNKEEKWKPKRRLNRRRKMKMPWSASCAKPARSSLKNRTSTSVGTP
jgi:hypothetical protein